MNIIQVAPQYSPRTGGVETHLKEISERLVERGHNVLSLTADDGEDVRSAETRNGVKVIRHDGFDPNDAFHVAPGILRTLRRHDADVVHAHNYHSLPLLFAAIATNDARFVATPHYHGGSASSFRDRLLSLYRPAGSWALRQADTVIAVSEWEREQLQSDFNVSVVVIPNGVDIKRFQDTEPKQHERPYLLTVGRLEKYKGVQHIIRALPNLPKYDLLVAGSGNYEPQLRDIVTKTGVKSQVKFLGYVPDEDLPRLYTGATAFVTMSSFEAYGMTVGEALAAGTPTVVRERGGLIDWTKRNDCTGVTSTDPESVTKAVEEAATSNCNIESLPTWGETADKIEACYENLL
jgi:glycosyltransferase involved in cell wall biosynthesis